MRRFLVLILLGILFGQASFCEERVTDYTQEELSEEMLMDEQLVAPDASVDTQQTDLPIEEDTQVQQSSTPQEFDLNDPANIPEIYRSLDVPTHKYVHDLDPEEFVDTQNAAWSPYSLFRLTAPLYFKTIAINPGYYLLTPREHAGNWYMLFKESGKVKYIIPIYNKEIVPMDFYKDNLPEEKTTWSQRQHLKLLKFVGKFKSSQRPEMPKTYLEAEDLDDNFIVIKLYWGDYKYSMVLRSIPM